MTTIVEYIMAIITGTPLYVWVLLGYLLIRGVKATKDSEVSIQKMLIVPSVFILWGIEKIITHFTYLNEAFLLYFMFLMVGAVIGYYLYRKYRPIYSLEGVFYRKGSYLSMCIFLINFGVKYTLNVVMSIHPELIHNLDFTFIYGAACGISVGLFVGGIYQTKRTLSFPIEKEVL